jgi:hypothetical protein
MSIEWPSPTPQYGPDGIGLAAGVIYLAMSITTEKIFLKTYEY